MVANQRNPRQKAYSTPIRSEGAVENRNRDLQSAPMHFVIPGLAAALGVCFVVWSFSRSARGAAPSHRSSRPARSVISKRGWRSSRASSRRACAAPRRRRSAAGSSIRSGRPSTSTTSSRRRSMPRWRCPGWMPPSSGSTEATGRSRSSAPAASAARNPTRRRSSGSRRAGERARSSSRTATPEPAEGAVRAALGVPLVDRSGGVGWLGVFSRDHSAFGDDDLRRRRRARGARRARARERAALPGGAPARRPRRADGSPQPPLLPRDARTRGRAREPLLARARARDRRHRRLQERSTTGSAISPATRRSRRPPNACARLCASPTSRAASAATSSG